MMPHQMAAMERDLLPPRSPLDWVAEAVAELEAAESFDWRHDPMAWTSTAGLTFGPEGQILDACQCDHALVGERGPEGIRHG